MHIVSGDGWAGAEAQAYTLLSRLAASSPIDVEATVLNDGELRDRIRMIGISCEVLDETQLGAVKLLALLRGRLQERKPDIVHTHRLKENVLGALANASSIRVPMVRTQHGSAEHNPGFHELRKWIARKMDTVCGVWMSAHVVAVSQSMAPDLRSRFGDESVSIIPNGLDIQDIQAKQLNRPHGIAKKKGRNIGFIGRLEPVKRVDIFLRTADILLREVDSAWWFHIFGAGSERERLEELSKELGIGDRICFHGHSPDALAHLSTLDVLLMCSDHEGLPMVALEALAVGTPVVAHAVGGLCEVLADESGGVLVRDQTPEAFAQAIVSLWDRDLEQLKVKGLERLRRAYTAEANATAYEELYRVLHKNFRRI